MEDNQGSLVNTKATRNVLLALLGFLALGAIGGGLVLIISPSGDLIGIPVSEFKNTPFDSYLIPGIILFTVLGIVPLLLIYGLVKKPASKFAEQFNIFKDMYWAWTFSVYIGFVLISWIHIQLIFLQGGVFWLHTFYLFYGILIIIIALLPRIRFLYSKHNT